MNEQESYSDLDNPYAHLGHLPRQQRRAAIRAEQKAEKRSPKHAVLSPKDGEYDGMPPETAADILSDSKGRITNTFRKTCKAARTKVHVPTMSGSKAEGHAERKIREKNFRQLRKSFRRSYAKRFDHIPMALKRINPDRVFVNRQRVIGNKAAEICQRKSQILQMASTMHGHNIRLVSNEIRHRHMVHLLATQPQRFGEAA